MTVDTSPLPFGRPRVERADAARNREHLLEVAREMLAEQGVKRLTMDALAERAELGKGTVFRRFGSRPGIFAALLDDAAHKFQAQVLGGPPPLGPGADAIPRLTAYGATYIGFVFENHEVLRAALDLDKPVIVASSGFSTNHIRMLLGQARREGRFQAPDIDTLATQLTAALEGPPLLYFDIGEDPARDLTRRAALIDSWTILIERVVRER